MNGLELFFKQNAIEKENIKYAASERFQGEDKKPLEWELKALTADEDKELRNMCTKLIPVPGKKGQMVPQLNLNDYMAKLAAASIVYPELDNAKLQDSYGAHTKPELLMSMLLPGEYQDLLTKVQEINGFKGFDDLVDEAKN